MTPIGALDTEKLDGLGPLDNRPSTDKLQDFVRKKKKGKRFLLVAS